MDTSGLPPIPLFDGTSPFSKWLLDFDSHCAARKWVTEAKGQFISLFLTGKALTAYRRLPPTSRTSYDVICTELQRSLEPPTPRMIKQCETVHLPRQPNEFVEDYAFRVSSALHTAYPDANQLLLDQIVASHVCNSLSSSIRRSLILSNITKSNIYF